MYKKEELEAMEIPQLMGIANELGIKVSQDSALEDVIYAIIDKAAENSAESADEAPKKKRTRISKKDSSTSRVYTVKGKDGENLDSKSHRTKKVEPAPLFSDEPLPPLEPTEEPEAPKRRGRKPKAKVEEVVEQPEQPEQIVEEEPQPEQEPQSDFEFVPEAMDEVPQAPDEDTVDAVEKLREKMANRRETVSEYVTEDGVWEGDPGDGTDFITIVDIPIEDQEAIPTLDMFDRPVAIQKQPEMEATYVRNQPINVPKYDFADLIDANGVLECLTDGY